MSLFGSERAASFGKAADAYERGRPEYPAAAVDWLVPAGARRVLDVGAGTGKLTRQLVERCLDVVAVEPSAGMRERLVVAAPGARALAGSAERIPLDDACVDAAFFARAWHWVDVERASAEVARVLVPGGTLGLLWNDRDERVGWVAELGRIMHRGDTSSETTSSNPPVGRPFGPLERFDTEWTSHISHHTLVDLVTSRSHFIVMPESERENVLAELRALVTDHPDLAGRDVIDLPYVTRCWRCVSQASAPRPTSGGVSR